MASQTGCKCYVCISGQKKLQSCQQSAGKNSDRNKVVTGSWKPENRYYGDEHGRNGCDRCSILFPGYYGNSTINSRTINYHIGVNIEKLFDLLTEQILAGLCFGTSIEGRCNACSDSKREEAARLAAKFISKLPVMRRVLATDVEAAYNGDPAAESYGEVIFCYPAIKAISNYRIAHELLELGVPLIPRIITEMAHSETGIDIHPAAKIGSHSVSYTHLRAHET